MATTAKLSKLRSMRQEAGITVELMAVTLGLTVKTISNWERSERPKAFQEMAYGAAIEKILASARRSGCVYERRHRQVPVLIDQRATPRSNHQPLRAA